MVKIKFITTLLFCVVALLQINAQTYYYTKQAIVINGNRMSASGDGHYLTFTEQGLYESDENGYSLGLGFVRYVSTDLNGRRCYEGNGYLGYSLLYRISSDYGRINVTLSDNSIAVYVKAPAGSGLKRDYRKQEQYVSVPPDISITEAPSSSNYSRQLKVKKTCPGCGGHGYIEGVSHSVSHFGIDKRKPDYRTCPKCGHKYNANDAVHTDIKCKVCNGAGYIMRRSN